MPDTDFSALDAIQAFSRTHEGARSEQEVVRAPWTREQVASLNAFQRSERYHPYTCPSEAHSSHLVASKQGWYCPMCAYTQGWAHTWSADWSWQL
jgi:hypothetical protein